MCTYPSSTLHKLNYSPYLRGFPLIESGEEAEISSRRDEWSKNRGDVQEWRVSRDSGAHDRKGQDLRRKGSLGHLSEVLNLGLNADRGACRLIRTSALLNPFSTPDHTIQPLIGEAQGVKPKTGGSTANMYVTVAL